MALWMPVLSAVRRNAWLKAFYEHLCAAGKISKLALVAAPRKLMHVIYSVAKTGDPSKSDRRRRARRSPTIKQPDAPAERAKTPCSR